MCVYSDFVKIAYIHEVFGLVSIFNSKLSLWSFIFNLVAYNTLSHEYQQYFFVFASTQDLSFGRMGNSMYVGTF